MAANEPLRKKNEASNRVGSVFSPHPLKNRNFAFQNETLAVMADAELGFAFLDEQSALYPYKHALKVLLAQLEAWATICIDGVAPNIEATLIIEENKQAKRLGYNPTMSIRGTMSDSEFKASKAAVRYYETILEIADGSENFLFDTKSLLELHRKLMYEDGAQTDEEMHFREQPYRLRMNLAGKVNNVYLAPEPSKIPELVNDLMDFCNKPNLSPVTQAAVAHFHLEALRPFKTGMDRTGRAFCHMIMKRRSFYKNIIPPIAVVPALDVIAHAKLLFPYRDNKPFSEMEAALALDRWTMHCAECLVLAVGLIKSLMEQISELENNWRKRFPNLRSGSILDMTLNELPGKPMVTVSSIMASTGKGFSAVNDAVKQMVDADILTPLNANHRNRIFKSNETLKVIHAIADKLTPTEMVTRESAFI